MFKIILFFTCISALTGSSQSRDIQCNYSTKTVEVVGSVYECQLENDLDIKTRESAMINSSKGSHLSGKSNSDVTAISSGESFFVINYFPRNLDKTFKNLKMIDITFSQMKEIKQSDLKPFTKLVFLSLSGNQIESLENGLFDFNSELKLVSFWDNKITKIGTQVFDNLNKLTHLYLNWNECINMKAENDRTRVLNVIKQAKAKCL